MTKSNKFWLNLILSILGFSGSNAHGANEHGNGGDVLVCKDPSGNQTVEMLDFWEARELRGLQINLRNIPFRERAVLAMKELLSINQDMGVLYIQWADLFLDEATFLTNVDLPDINDTGDLLIPENCEIKQIAIQKTPRTANDKRYIIDKRLWEKLDDNNRAGLIIHEVVYRDALRRGHLNSINVRIFTGLIASKNLNFFDRDTMELGFREYRYQSEHFLYRLLESVFPRESYRQIRNYGPEVAEFNSADNAVKAYILDIKATYPSINWYFDCIGKNGFGFDLSSRCSVSNDGITYFQTDSYHADKGLGRLVISQL